jgi:carbonic anhydrase
LNCFSAFDYAHGEPAAPPDAGLRHHWGYESQKVVIPKNWRHLSGSKTCGSKTRQSPIQIAVPESVFKNPRQLKKNTFKFKYSKNLKFFVFHNSHTVQGTVASPKNKTNVTLKKNNGKSRFGLKQFHYHVPSEHSLLVHGKPKKHFAELHFVHENLDAPGQLLVYGVFVELDKSPSPTSETNQVLDQWINAYHSSGDYLSGIRPIELDINKLLVKRGPHALYNGSLTTPPCSEVVTWLVALNPIKVDQSHFDNLRKYIRIGFENARPTQNTTSFHELKFLEL